MLKTQHRARNDLECVGCGSNLRSRRGLPGASPVTYGPSLGGHLLRLGAYGWVVVRLPRRTVSIQVADDGFSRAQAPAHSANRLRRWIFARSCATGPAKHPSSASTKRMRVRGKRTTTYGCLPDRENDVGPNNLLRLILWPWGAGRRSRSFLAVPCGD